MAHTLAPKAEDELDEIWLYVAKESGSVEIADCLVGEITQRFFLLSCHPYIGRKRNDLREGLRSFAVGAYVILYRTDGNDVKILHIIRGSRDILTLVKH